MACGLTGDPEAASSLRSAGSFRMELSGPPPIARPSIYRGRPDDPIRATLLETVRDPSRHPADGEGRREERHFEVESVQQQGRVELHICLEVTSRLVLLEQPQRRPLDRAR